MTQGSKLSMQSARWQAVGVSGRLRTVLLVMSLNAQNSALTQTNRRPPNSIQKWQGNSRQTLCRMPPDRKNFDWPHLSRRTQFSRYRKSSRPTSRCAYELAMAPHAPRSAIWRATFTRSAQPREQL